MRSRRNLKGPNSIDEDLYDLSVVSNPGNAETVKGPVFQSWETHQHYANAQVPGVLQPLAMCYTGQSAHGSVRNEGYITRDMEYQVTRQWS